MVVLFSAVPLDCSCCIRLSRECHTWAISGQRCPFFSKGKIDKLKSVKTEGLGERKGTPEIVTNRWGPQNGRARLHSLLKNSYLSRIRLWQGLKSLCENLAETTDLSTTLRFGRDDKFVATLISHYLANLSSRPKRSVVVPVALSIGCSSSHTPS